MPIAIAEAIAGIEETAWVPIDYTPDGNAQVAENDYNGRRLMVRRTRLDRRQHIVPGWRHFGFLSDLEVASRSGRLPSSTRHR